MEPPDDLDEQDYAPSAPPAAPSAPNALPAELNHGRPSLGAPFLDRLNRAQREAVTADSNGGLAVHAGPGSGKTAVLTTRVAYLVDRHQIEPEHLV